MQCLLQEEPGGLMEFEPTPADLAPPPLSFEHIPEEPPREQVSSRATWLAVCPLSWLIFGE